MSSPEDLELLKQFNDCRSAEAFKVLVDRHASMVFSICHQITRNAHDSEDAVQAVFLALSKKAGALLREQKMLSLWLHRASVLAGRQIVRDRSRRENREKTAAQLHAGATLDLDEIQERLQGAVNRLPDRYREVIVLRYFTGQSPLEVAQHLGCPKKTVESRITRALTILRTKLQREGAVVSAILLVGMLESRLLAAGAEYPAALSGSLYALGVLNVVGGKEAQTVQQLAQEILRALWWAKVKMAASAFLVLAALVSAGSWVSASVFAPTAKEEKGRERPLHIIGQKGDNRRGERVVRDGQRLDDRTIWRVIGDLPQHAGKTELAIKARNEDRAEWRVGGLLHHRAWDLNKGPISLSCMTLASKDERRHWVGLCVIPATKGLTENVALATALRRASRYSPADTVHPGSEKEPAPRTKRKWLHREIIFSRTMTEIKVDGKVVFRRALAAPVERVFLGFRVVVRDFPGGEQVRVRNVTIRQLPPSSGSAEVEF